MNLNEMDEQVDRPTGTITFLFSDIEGSTGLAESLGPDTYRELLEQHHRLLRAALTAHGGIERGTQGDSFLVVFRHAPEAVAAAVRAQRSLAAAVWPQGAAVRVRMGLHTGDGTPGGDDYVGTDINRAARISAAAHGGQLLISDSVRALSGRALPDGASVRDMGSHWLRGLSTPERLYQVTIPGLQSDFPPLRTSRTLATELPARMTSFVGRDSEIAELRDLLAVNRLVTLLGPGGTGKSSLALELARTESDHFTDGAWFVPLETVTVSDLVPSAIVAGLGLLDATGRPARERLIDNLSERQLLLVLDNFEQVLDAAGPLGELLAKAPAVKVIVTSRAPLRLTAEQTYNVAPLPVPQPAEDASLERLREVASVRLFIDRARRVSSSFSLAESNAEAVADICRRLDGLPLGIELAAARVSLLGPAEIRDRMAAQFALPGSGLLDAPARHRTLADTVAWSHDLLEPDAQALFARLAVFRGGWRATELQLIFGGRTPPDRDPLDLVGGLVEQSLVVAAQHGEGVRYELLDTIRQFAAQRFADADDRPAVLRSHALAYLARAESGAVFLPGRAQLTVLADLATERANFRAALEWSADSGEVEVGLRLGTALSWFWVLRGEVEEGKAALTKVLTIPGADAPTEWRMRALEAAGTLLYYSGANDRASELYRAQLELARQLEDQQCTGDALFNLTFALDPTQLQHASEMLAEAARIYSSLGAEGKLARLAWAQGNERHLRGQQAEAEMLWHESFDRLHDLDDPIYEAMAASSLGWARLHAGDREGSARWFAAALRRVRDIDVIGTVMSLPVMATVALEFAGPSAAATMMGAYDALSRRYGIRLPLGLETVIGRSDPLLRIRAGLDPLAFEEASARGRAMRPEEAVAFVMEALGQP